MEHENNKDDTSNIDDDDNVFLCCFGKSFCCSRQKLCSRSDYFQAMFSSGMRETSSDTITIDMYHPSIMTILIQYIEDGKSLPTQTDLVHEVLQAAVYFQIGGLQQECEECIIKTANMFNSIQLWKRYPVAKHMREITEKLITENICTVAETEDFLNLDGDEMIHFLSKDNLIVEDPSAEVDLCKHVIRWFERGSGNTENYIKGIFKLLKLPLIDKRYLNQLKRTFYFSENKDFKRIVRKAEEYQDNAGMQLCSDHFSSQPRACYTVQKALIVLGLFHKFYTSGVHKLFCFFLHKKSWHALSDPPPGLANDHTACTYGESHLFVSGGKHSRQVWKYNGLTNKWTSCTPMKEARMKHCMIAVKNHVFCLGGAYLSPTNNGFEEINVTSVTKYQPESDGSWKNCGDLTIGVVNAVCAVYKDRIFVVGGNVPDFQDPLTAVQCFNVETFTCSVVCHTSFLFEKVCIAYSTKSIYALGGKGVYKTYKFKLENFEFQEKGGYQNVFLDSPEYMAYFNKSLLVIGRSGDLDCEKDTLYQLDIDSDIGYKVIGNLPQLSKHITKCNTLMINYNNI